MLADCLTKSSAPPDALIKAVNTGLLPDADVHPPFRQLMQNKHKAFLISWMAQNLKEAPLIYSFPRPRSISRFEKYFTKGASWKNG